MCIWQKVIRWALTKDRNAITMDFVARCAPCASRDVPHVGGDGSKTARSLVLHTVCRPSAELREQMPPRGHLSFCTPFKPTGWRGALRAEYSGNYSRPLASIRHGPWRPASTGVCLSDGPDAVDGDRHNYDLTEHEGQPNPLPTALAPLHRADAISGNLRNADWLSTASALSFK